MCLDRERRVRSFWHQEAGAFTKAEVPVASFGDKIVYLPCLKTHDIARFSGALKLAVGFMHPGERRALHALHLEQKIAEINLCWQPDPWQSLQIVTALKHSLAPREGDYKVVLSKAEKDISGTL